MNMLLSTSVLCLALWTILLSSVGAFKPIVIDDSNFEQLVSKGTWLLEFYADWCGYCNRAKPDYDRVAKAVREQFPDVQVGKVNVDDAPGLNSVFFISRIPQLYFVKDGQVRTLKTDINYNAIMTMLEKEEWKSVAPWKSFWGPFNLFAKVLSLIGIYGKLLFFKLRGFILGMDNPVTIGLSILGFILMVSIFSLMFVPTTSEEKAKETKDESKKKK